MNRFAHLKEPVEAAQAEVTQALETPTGAPPDVAGLPAAGLSSAPALPDVAAEPADDLQELVHLVERRIGIVGKIPASLKDAYDEMLLRTRKYIGRPNADLAVQAWVELTLEDEVLRRRWLKRMQELRKQ